MRVLACLVLAAAAAGVLAGCSGQPQLPPRPTGHATLAAAALKPPVTVTAVVAPPKRPVTRFGDGKYEVIVDIPPGRYKTPGPETSAEKCYWARLKDFTGSVRSAHSMGYGNQGPDVVVIEPGDKGFETRGCGTWTRVK
ncbi:MAG: hypothetical protein ACRDTZ_01185 [Pseudonocardiaceae bacterium]